MSKKYIYAILAILIVMIGIGIGVFSEGDRSEEIVQFVQVDREARIYPDYSSIVVPPNIAPMNFTVREDGELYCVKIRSGSSGQIEVFSKTGKIVIDRGL